VHSVTNESCDWRALAYAFGTLLTHEQGQDTASEQQQSDRLVGLVVHELRTPVAIIKAYAELLEAQATTRHSNLNASREVMGHIREQADLMADWVDAMLDMRRMQLGELPLDLTRVDLVQLAWMVAEEFQQTTRRHHIRVVAQRPPPQPILADRSRLRQVLSNLVENSIRYAAGGTIVIHLGNQPGSGHVVVAVRDEGPGLDVGELDRIFAPFEQAQRTGVGLGLGLYLARQIARIHGGELWAESRGHLNGSTFVLSLPLTGKSGASVRSRADAPPQARRMVEVLNLEGRSP
jgi:signal transduction histidine kinase